MDKKGFLFTVTVFLVLMYILLTISVWVKGIETSERAFSEFYKESTVELAIEQITPAKMDNVTFIIMNRGLATLNDHTIEKPIKEGPDGDEMANLRAAMFELIMNGSADSQYFKGTGGGITGEENSSLREWGENLNASLQAIGVHITRFEVTGFEIGQSDIDKVNYSFTIDLELKDITNTTAVSRSYPISNELDITGLVDPALARETEDLAGGDDTVYRMFFFNKDDYSDNNQIDVGKIHSSQGGEGWFYGPLAKANGSLDPLVPDAVHGVSPLDRRHYILVGKFKEIVDLQKFVYEGFAGYIITDLPTTTTGSCGTEEQNTFNPMRKGAAPDCDPYLGTPPTANPFIIANNFNPADAEECPVLNSNITRRCALFISKHTHEEVANDPSLKTASSPFNGIYDVEELRDFIMCGYYTHNPKAPSYLQRLLNDSYSRNSTDYGIETFVIGNYANDYGAYDLNSRLDRELTDGGISGIRIRGMPGCKDFSSCADEPITGVFAVSAEARDDYGLGDIACDNGAAGCGS